MSRFALAKIPTPLLNIPHFPDIFSQKTLPLDESGLFRGLEMIALPQTKFEILQQINEKIVEVKTIDYPCSPLFVDNRFLIPCSSSTPDRQKILPSIEKILTCLHAAIGVPYLWGGNWKEGIPQMLSFYQPHVSDSKLFTHWTLQGLDCSGLLYEATSGYTPRNTSELLYFGEPILIENKKIKDIKTNVSPLDLIVWKGHVIIVLDNHCVIESTHKQGKVLISPLEKCLEQRMFQEKRIPKNSWPQQNASSFVIRRFYNGTKKCIFKFPLLKKNDLM